MQFFLCNWLRFGKLCDFGIWISVCVCSNFLKALWCARTVFYKDCNCVFLYVCFRFKQFCYCWVGMKCQLAFLLRGWHLRTTGYEEAGLMFKNSKLWTFYLIFYSFALLRVLKQNLADYPVRSSQPQRAASLNRFREKRKERCFEKKIRYTVRKEVALRL